MHREAGLTAIIAYKLIKGVLWLVVAGVLVVMMPRGLNQRLLELAWHLRHHAGAWSLELADLVVRASTRRGLWVVVVALVSDSVVSCVEAWALIRGHWWGPWLVVVTTASFLPFEIVAFVRRRHAVRAVVFLVNLAIAVYLARKALREHKHAKKV